MKLSAVFGALLCPLVLAVSPVAVLAQGSFPTKPVRIIVPLSAGTGADAVARQLAEKLTAKWNQSVVVENRPGAGGITAVQALKQFPADGHTLLAGDPGMLAISPHILKKIPYDSKADFSAVAGLFRTYYMLATSGTGPIDSYAKLMAAAKSRPIPYASPGVGSPAHLGGEVLAEKTQTPMTHVAYKDASQMFLDLSNGNVTWMWATIGSLRPFVESKRIRLLASGGPHRQQGFEDVPTLAEVGGPKDLLVDTWYGLLVTKGTPADTINIINRDVTEAMRSPELQKRLAGLGFENLISSPAELDAIIDRDLRRYGAAVKGAHIEPQ